jgi:hypothetical protein
MHLTRTLGESSVSIGDDDPTTRLTPASISDRSRRSVDQMREIVSGAANETDPISFLPITIWHLDSHREPLR